MYFEGTPILIIFDTDNHVNHITTGESPAYGNWYDVDWVEDRQGHYTHLSGFGSFSRVEHEVSNWVSPEPEHKPLPTYYWSEPGLKVKTSEHCHRITAQDLFERLLSKEEQAEWLKNREKTVVTEEDVPSFFKYWDEWGDVQEGETIYCSACERRYATYYGSSVCIHIEWCDDCDEYSTPDGDCPHRSKDKLFYVEPEGAEDNE